jgi:hypothetical protein
MINEWFHCSVTTSEQINEQGLMAIDPSKLDGFHPEFWKMALNIGHVYSFQQHITFGICERRKE